MEYDKDYSGIFLTSLNEMRKADVMCDFTVKVGIESFSVHSVVLAAASKYFTALFSSKMKEVKEASVGMKSLTVGSVRQCIEYMYSGGVELENESVEETLKASDLIQLNGLTSICFKFLKNNLSVETCLSTANLSGLHGRDEVRIDAENYVLENFEAVTLTKMFPFISKSDLLHYIKASKADYNVTWLAVMKWFSIAKEESGKVLLDVLKSISLQKFPFQFLLETVLNEPLLKQNNPCNKLVIDSIFENVEKMKSKLSTENFFVVMSLMRSHEIPNLAEVKKVIDDYLAENFEELVKKDEFCSLEEEKIIRLFESRKVECSSEKIKWEAALRWTNRDQRRRKKVFEKLFKLIKLELLPSDFLQQSVRNETLVKESHECKDMLLDVAFARGDRERKKDEETLVPHILCSKSNGIIKALNLTTTQWIDLPSVEPNINQIVNVDNEIFCLVRKKVLNLNQNEMKWIQKQSRVKELSGYAEAVVFNKRIYLVDCDVTALYSVIDNVWKENLHGCGLYGEFCAAATDKFIYAIGGDSTADAKQFSQKTKSWSPIPKLHTGRRYASAAALHNTVFVVGGMSDRGKCLSSVEVFHEVFQTWTNIKSMCVRRLLSSACVANNRLYVVGGARNEKGNLLDPDSIETYDEDENKWKIVMKCDLSFWTTCCAVNWRCSND